MLKKIIFVCTIICTQNNFSCPPPLTSLLKAKLEKLGLPDNINTILLEEQKKYPWPFNIEIDEELRKIIVINTIGKPTHIFLLDQKFKNKHLAILKGLNS